MSFTSDNNKKFCRTCLVQTTETKHLFDLDAANLSLSDMLHVCTSLKIIENDDFPKQVCLPCANSIKKLFFFREECIKSYYTLKNIISSANDVQSTLDKRLEINLKNDNNDGNKNGESSGSCSLLQSTVDFNEEEKKCNEYKIIKRPLAKNRNKFLCELCAATFPTGNGLREHIRKHEMTRRTCSICNQKFSRSSTLSRHIASVHNEANAKKHVCNECGKGFARSDDLKRHIRTHTGEKPFQCNLCGKAFTQSFRLVEHTRAHENIKNFLCLICGKTYSRYTSLMAHNQTHTGAKTRECTECGKRLSGGNGSLKMHMKTQHSQLRDFPCNFCDKAFTAKSSLIIHIRTHTGEKPYTCDACGKSFADTSRLNVHYRIHSGERPHVCTICGKGCVSSSQLKKHTRVHTGE